MKDTTPNAVAWLEGMFLRPQHLQQQTEYLEGRLHEQLRMVDPYHWGVKSIELDEEALSDHRVEIRALVAVLPDGTLVRYPGNATLETREFPASAPSVDVYVGLKLVRPAEASAAHEDEERRDVRYRIRSESVGDLHRGGPAAEVDFLVPNLRVFLSGEDLDLQQHEAVRVARIVATGQKARPFALASDFAPPLLALQACPPLVEELARVLSLLEARIRVISGRTTTVSIADLPRLWMRYTLARMAPLVRQLLAAESTAPYPLYTTLVELAGALGAFRLTERANFPLYDHVDPFPGFQALSSQIKADLEEALPVRFRELPLRFDRSAYITKELSAELSNLKNQFYLGVKSSLSKDELLEHVKQAAKVASEQWITIMIRDNLSGLPIEPLPGPPTDIAAETGFEFWRLELRGKENEKGYARVRDSGSLAVSLGNLRDADVRLYIVTPPG
jgi:type VI secretion system protein ImpJ